ncbi:hypothetical protein BVRB_4g077090 [Beta vulgaris subsp. vulgaris]|nr:hypothetical protein BVRB_4g077090 [Beta vulgaris subsp. vulgaris]
MANEEVKLFGRWASPFSHRIQTALKLKGIPYEYIEEDLTNKSPQLLKYNPIHKKIPVLVHNGKPIVESLIILKYIDETWELFPLLPNDPWEKANALFWAIFIDEKLFRARKMALWGDEKESKEAMEETFECLRWLENELKVKKSKFFGGECIGFVDIVANGIGFWVGVQEEVTNKRMLVQERFPLLWDWAQDFVSCDAVKECLPPREKLLALYQARV